LVTPTFNALNTMCNPTSQQVRTGNKEFTYTWGENLSFSEVFCIEDSRFSIVDELLARVKSLGEHSALIDGMDTQWNHYALSGFRWVVGQTGLTSTGGMYSIGTDITNPTTTPAGTLSFAAVKKISDITRSRLMAGAYDPANDIRSLFVGSTSQIEAFRNELNVAQDVRAAVQGSYRYGEVNLLGATFEGPYRGIGFAENLLPLRFDNWNNGNPVFLQPFIQTVGTTGVGGIINPAWTTANYEVSFLLHADTVQRLKLPRYRGAGMVRFEDLPLNGVLTALDPNQVNITNGGNPRGNLAQLMFGYTRAWKPIKPYNIVTIIHKRCNSDDGITTCAYVPGAINMA
jgi:hypothetical protein